MIAFIACSSSKKSNRCKAKDIYTGELFTKSYELAEKMGAKIYILSAKHHLLDPEQEIDPYNSYLGDFSADDKKSWAEEVKRQIKAKHINTDQKVLFFAGEDYIEHLHGIFRDEQEMWKGDGIGYILQYLNNKLNENIRPVSRPMKTIFQCIMEARGVVTGKDSWSKLVDYIVNNFETDDNFEFHCNRKYLPPWMGDCIVRMESIPGTIATYADDESALIGDQMDVVVKITEKALKSVTRFKSSLEHELQHAYDDYIGRSRRNKSTFLDDDYCFAIGAEGSDYDNIQVWDIMDKPRACYFDHAFYICRESTYYLAPTEINAYLREFSLYLKSLKIKGKEFDWNSMSTDTKMDGELPLIGMWLTYYMRDHINEYTDMDWEYVIDSINQNWAPIVMGRTYSGKDAKAFVKVLDDIIHKKIRKPMERYIRVIKDSGVKTKNIPEWFK